MTAVSADSASLLADASFQSLKDHVLAMTGLAYYCDKDDELADRLSMRLGALNFTRAADYLSLLRQEPAGSQEMDLLIEHLTIGETHFFRHQEVFTALETLVLPEVSRRAAGSCIRVWSAGCANGAEAYSIGILLKQLQASGAIAGAASVIGTDISRRSLERATRAEYSDWDLRDTSAEVRACCFQRDHKWWVLNPEYRRLASFQYHNLVQHPLPSLLHNLCAFNIVLCRNVLMYFDTATVRRIVHQLHDTLVEGGWLIVGHAEANVELFAAFETVNVPGAVLYRKTARVSESRLESSRSVPIGRAKCVQDAPGPLQAVKPSAATSRPQQACGEALGNEDERVYLNQLEQIRRLANSGHLDQAENTCRILLQQSPLKSAPYLYLALISAQEQWHEPAIELLKKALYLDPELIVANLHLGLLYQRCGQAHAARRYLNRTLELLSEAGAHMVPLSDGMSTADVRELVLQQLEVC